MFTVQNTPNYKPDLTDISQTSHGHPTDIIPQSVPIAKRYRSDSEALSKTRRWIFLVVGMVIGMMTAFAQDTPTYQYFCLHIDGKGYMKQCKGVVNNDGTFRYENAYDSNGFSIWVYSSDGYLQNEMYYLNVLNGQTLVLSTTPVTHWNLVADGEKRRFQMDQSTKILGLDANNKVVLSENPAKKYAACTLTVVEEGGKWDGPKDKDFTVQSPQLVTYLRTYYIRNLTVTIDKNDAGTENVKVVDKKDSRSYCSRDFIPDTYNGQNSNWGFNNTTHVIYKITTSNSNVTATANYNVAPVDPITCARHPATVQSCKTIIKPKAFSPVVNMKYLIFNTQENNYRFPKENSDLSIGDLLPINGKQTDLTEEINGNISWEPIADDEGFFSFKNVTTGRYFYYDANDYTVSNYGAMKIGSSHLPDNDTKYKFKICTAGNRDSFGSCLYIVPYDMQFACVKDGGFIEELFFAIYVNTSTNTKIASLYKASDNAKWKLYKYEWQYRLWDDYSIIGDQEIYTAGDHIYTASTWFSRNIIESPSNSEYCMLPGSKTHNGIEYVWELTGLGDYIEMRDELSSGVSTLTASVTLPPGTRTGTLKVTAKITNPASFSNQKTIPLTLYNLNPTLTEITSLSQITNVNGLYKLTEDNTYSNSNKPIVTTFSGTLDGDGHIVSGVSQPLFETLAGGTVRNLNFNNVTIPSGTDVGTVCGEANGAARIYNVGVLGGSISGSNYVGGLVGKLDGEARVVNCFSYANITGGEMVGGIVGYNNVATTSANLKTMVMNCMFYGDFDTDNTTNRAPIYNGQIITNRSDASGVSNFNYFWAGASYVQNQKISTYNCALAAETRFLQRFEFFRYLLNSNRELAAWWATGRMDNVDLMMKWVLEPSQIGTTKPYPVLKAPKDSNNNVIKYPSVVNIDADHAEAFSSDPAIAKTQYNQGRKFGTLTINIQNASSGAPDGATVTTTSVTPNITDKDPSHFNFNYYKVQLPYYNDVGTKNYTGNKVVTGWKIVSISGGTHSFSTGSEASAVVDEDGNITLTTPYNFADRKSTDKDKFGVSGRVFSQGAYFDVPEGVTSITIEPYWGKCVYVSDEYPDVVYKQDMSAAANVTTVGGGSRFTNNTEYDINGSSQKVYTTMGNAVTALDPSGTVYDNAIVLVGNVHSLDLSNKTNNKPYTIMSIDLDKDNEPDYSYILRFNGRNRVHPVRVDFLNIIGLGMAQKSNGGTGTYNFGIMQPYGWFEVTNTGLFRVTQLEYDRKGRTNSPMILLGGVIEQWVTYAQGDNEANAVQYYHVGSNVWFKEFHIGQHQDRIEANAYSPHPPVSVTGGDYEEFYLTGLYNTPTNNYDDNAECYINGGRFGKMAGTGMQGIGHATNHTNGNIVWQIDNADINEFYAGGINAAHIAQGDIRTVITNSRVDQFCGGPKFGDMNSAKTVVTNATNCTFRTFFGAGYGGNSYNRRYPKNRNNVININWDDWIQNGGTFEGEYFEGYKNEYISDYGGVGSRIDYQFIPMSNNTSNVARLFVDYVCFSLATTYNVTSKLTGCTITTSELGNLNLFEQCIGNYYGGGSLGKVAGPVRSTLIDCTVEGNVFGAGYSATLPSVAVMNNSFQTQPHYDENLGAYLDAVLPSTVSYSWEHNDVVNSTATAINTSTHKLYTTVDLSKSNLGSVGIATLTIKGNTSVGGNVFGGGDDSAVTGNTTVILQGAAHVLGNVYGGGNNGAVGGNSEVKIENGD